MNALQANFSYIIQSDSQLPSFDAFEYLSNLNENVSVVYFDEMRNIEQLDEKLREEGKKFERIVLILSKMDSRLESTQKIFRDFSFKKLNISNEEGLVGDAANQYVQSLFAKDCKIINIQKI